MGDSISLTVALDVLSHYDEPEARAIELAVYVEVWGKREMRQAPTPRSRKAAAETSKGNTAQERRAGMTIRVDFGAFGYLGPGKVQLLELIDKHGSISSAGKQMGMSYRRAWLLVDEINQTFREPLVEKQMGGSGGGGASLSALGRDVVARYRAIQKAAAKACAQDLTALTKALPEQPAPGALKVS